MSLGSNPGFGFKVVNKEIVEDTEKSGIVLRIFEMYANGSTVLEITNYLNSIGVKTKKDKPFSKNSLQKMFRNKRYIGIYTYKGTETPDILPCLIPKALFEKVQKRLVENVGAGGRGKAVEGYILSGKLYCGHCFTPMTGTSGTGRNGKLHSYYKEKGKGCKSFTVTKHRIENKVIEVVREMLSEENMQLIAREISSLCNIEMENPNFKRLQRLINENNKQKANLLKSLKIGKASPNAASYVFRNRQNG